jgi:hypothetical protein
LTVLTKLSALGCRNSSTDSIDRRDVVVVEDAPGGESSCTGSPIMKPLVAETNAVPAERRQPALPDGVSAHALRKTYFTFLHEAGVPPRWVADQGGHADPSTSLRIYTESLRDRERSELGQAFYDPQRGQRRPRGSRSTKIQPLNSAPSSRPDRRADQDKIERRQRGDREETGSAVVRSTASSRRLSGRRIEDRALPRTGQ